MSQRAVCKRGKGVLGFERRTGCGDVFFAIARYN